MLKFHNIDQKAICNINEKLLNIGAVKFICQYWTGSVDDNRIVLNSFLKSINNIKIGFGWLDIRLIKVKQTI